MKSVPFEYNGVTYALSFTAEALFRIYEKYGEDADVLGCTHFMENTREGWQGACWLGALLASQGELQRRYMGEDPIPMLPAEELRRGASVADMLALRRAIQEALHIGLTRTVADGGAEEEIDVVLQERSALEKKTKALAAAALDGLRSVLGGWGSRSGSSAS